MDEDFKISEPIPSDKCVEIQCEYCASSCCTQSTSCMYTKPPTLHPIKCPLNKWEAT